MSIIWGTQVQNPPLYHQLELFSVNPECLFSSVEKQQGNREIGKSGHAGMCFNYLSPGSTRLIPSPQALLALFQLSKKPL